MEMDGDEPREERERKIPHRRVTHRRESKETVFAIIHAEVK